MAVKMVFDLYDLLSNFLDTNDDFKITATDLDGNTQVVTSSLNTRKYILSKYATRRFPVIKGDTIPTSEGALELASDFRMWVINRQRNIDIMYQALYDYDYSPIENTDRYESEITNTDDTTTYGKKNTESGSDTTMYGKVDTLSGSDANVRTGKETTSNSKAGFNSTNTYTPTDKSETQYTNLTDTETYGKTDTLSGSDSVTYGRVDTESGSDVKDVDIERTLHIHGNIGVTTLTFMIDELLSSRQKETLAEMLIDNFINDYTFYS